MTTKDTMPFHIWKHDVQTAAIAKGADGEHVMASSENLQKRYQAGEPVWMAADELAFVAKARPAALRAEAEDAALRRIMGAAMADVLDGAAK